MLTAIRKIKGLLVRVLDTAVAIIMAVLVLDVLWQIIVRVDVVRAAILRVFPNASFKWTDELATKLLIWLMLLGACVAFDRKSHLGVDYFVNKLPGAGQRAMAMVVHALTALFAGSVLIYGGAEVVRLVLKNKQPLPALGIEMGYVYLALPISGVIIFLIALENFIEVAVPPPPRASEEQEDA